MKPGAGFPRRWPLFLLVASAISLSSALAVSALLTTLGLIPKGASPFSYPLRGPWMALVFTWGLLVLSPVVETFVLCVLISLGIRLRIPPLFAVVLGALVWAFLHSMAWGPWGFVVFPAFLVFGYTFVRWRYLSFSAGFVSATVVHALHNVVPTVTLLLTLKRR